MIRFETPNGVAVLVEHPSELPDPPSRIKRLYADCETGAPTLDGEGISPYEGALACGWAVTWDDHPIAYYVPYRHRDKRWNLPEEVVRRWLRDVMRISESWVNHNVKFDAHFALADSIEPPARLVCTLNRAKLVDSDRMGHGLKQLSRDWLDDNRKDADRVAEYLASVKLPRNKKCRDFSTVPADILGEYACGDVLSNRVLDHWLRDRKESEQAELWETEVKLTSVLLDMEREGMRVDLQANKIEKLRCIRTLINCCERVKELTGMELIDSNDCYGEIIVNRLGLPILSRTDTGAPSFDADAMLLYAGLPAVLTVPATKEIMGLLVTYRKESRFMTLYVESFERFCDADGWIHPTYNQTIRTGRMSASRPNSQQQNERSKALIIPREGEAFLCSDASQIEFRMMMHYIQDERALAAYKEDPLTDFHNWVAGLCGVKRSPAKTLNFAMGFGAGRRRVTATLMSNEDLVREVEAMVDSGEVKGLTGNKVQDVETLVAMRANSLYEQYHAALPGLKATASRAAQLVRARGYIKNAYGRRRHLPAKLAHRAFNTLNQGGAMDLIKERMVAISSRYNDKSRALGLTLNADVHDELLMSGPRDWILGKESIPYVSSILEKPRVQFRVPFPWKTGVSEKNWAEAKT